jgi:hypothetical protein
MLDSLRVHKRENTPLSIFTLDLRIRLSLLNLLPLNIIPRDVKKPLLYIDLNGLSYFDVFVKLFRNGDLLFVAMMAPRGNGYVVPQLR